MNVEGKQISLRVLQARIGPEYGEDGASTITLLTALIRDVEDVEGISDQVEVVVDLWRRRRVRDICKQFHDDASKKSSDTSYLLTDFENCIKDIALNSQSEPVKRIGEIARGVMVKSKKAQDGGSSIGIEVGLPSLQEIMGTIHRGDLGYILAAQGDGKTVVGLQLLRAAADRGNVGNLVELEMKDEDIAARSLASDSDVPISQIEEGAYDFYQYENLQNALEGLQGLPIYIDDRPMQTVESVRERAIFLKRTKDLAIMVVDHMRLVQTMKRFNNKFDRIEYVSMYLKAMAKDLDIAVIGLSQVTRASQRRDDPVPRIGDSDLGSAVEQDADWALSLFRRDRHLKDFEPHDRDSKEHNDWVAEFMKHKGKIEVRCVKRRRGAAGEMRQFGFDGPRYRIYELER